MCDDDLSQAGAPVAVTDATLRKRAELLEFVTLKLSPHAAVQAVVATGSVATGTARPDSDIDAYVFMDPVDLYLVPAESVWRPRDDTFHSIFSGDPSLDQEGRQLDLHRVDLPVWQDPAYVWPEHAKAELAGGWVAFDRNGQVAPLIAERTRMTGEERLRLIDDAVDFVAAQLPDPGEVPTTSPVLTAVDSFDELQAAYEYLVRALFAYNRRWLPWRNREMRTLVRLPWLPSSFDRHVMDAAIGSGHDRTAYLARAAALRELLAELLDRLVADGFYHEDDPISEAFKRTHDEPGRAWNMTDWNETHRRRAAPGAG